MDFKALLASGFDLLCDVAGEIFAVLTGGESSLDWPMEEGRPSLGLGLTNSLDQQDEEFHPHFDA